MKKQKNETIEVWADRSAEVAGVLMMKSLLKSTAGRTDAEIALVYMRLISSMVYHIAGAALSLNDQSLDTDTEEALLQSVRERYAVAKVNVEDSVSVAFETAMYAVTGQSVEYACQVTQIESRSKALPC